MSPTFSHPHLFSITSITPLFTVSNSILLQQIYGIWYTYAISTLRIRIKMHCRTLWWTKAHAIILCLTGYCLPTNQNIIFSWHWVRYLLEFYSNIFVSFHMRVWFIGGMQMHECHNAHRSDISVCSLFSHFVADASRHFNVIPSRWSFVKFFADR